LSRSVIFASGPSLAAFFAQRGRVARFYRAEASPSSTSAGRAARGFRDTSRTELRGREPSPGYNIRNTSIPIASTFFAIIIPTAKDGCSGSVPSRGCRFPGKRAALGRRAD
jgi:hypothetical protein